jgi:hypothetical protein
MYIFLLPPARAKCSDSVTPIFLSTYPSFRFASSLLNVSFTASSFRARLSASVSVKHDHYVTCKRCTRQLTEQGCRSLIGWNCHAYSTFSLDTSLHGDDPMPPVIGHDVRCDATPLSNAAGVLAQRKACVNTVAF